MATLYLVISAGFLAGFIPIKAIYICPLALCLGAAALFSSTPIFGLSGVCLTAALILVLQTFFLLGSATAVISSSLVSEPI